MKKTNRQSSQTTLFQTWGKTGVKPEQKIARTTLFQTWDNPTSKPVQSTGTSSISSTNKIRSSQDEDKFDDVINLDEDEDDEQLLAAVYQTDSFAFEYGPGESNAGICQDGNLSFSARPGTPDDLTENEVIRGFDTSAGNRWIFPTNYPIRDYQFNIVQKALFQNTLVTLPTGLGKTFIAAVVMYNFYRWYPQGKIIFMAPTKPLVAQQIDACYNIMGIPQQDTAEMTGNMAPAKRELFWTQKRVFFLTPQVFQNDLSRGSCRAEDVVCLVIDEAHKALGNHAYCQVVRELLGYNQQFRVLALSATPGDGIKAVQQVITNLLVSHIELRSEDSADIKPYTHQRQVEKIVIKLGEELEFFKMKFLRVLNVVVNRLAANQVIWHKNVEKISKYMLLTAREQFRKTCANGNQLRTQMGSIEGDFAVAISFYHAYELLLQHGLLPFYNFMKGIVDGTKGSSRAKTELTRNPDFVAIMDDLREQIELPADQCDGNAKTRFGEVSPKVMSPQNRAKINPLFVGHPKLTKLKEIVLEHFRKYETFNCEENKTDSRVMIFSQFRDSVQEITSMFSTHEPLVRVMSFIGQQSKSNSSKGLTQKEQLKVIQKFRSGGYNTLVATCVGEEGLDIGEVDLIICFDASASPIRLVQRMGRTGRKRAGHIIVLVTEGKEEQIYQRSQRSKTNIHKSILESARTLDLYLENPRMVPKNLNPVCQKMYITVEKKTPKKSKSETSGRKKSDGNIKSLLSTSSTSRRDNGFLSPQELHYWRENFKLPDHEGGLTPSRSITMRPRGLKSSDREQPEHALSLNEWTAWQTALQPFLLVNHSKRARHFTEILEFCDFRRDCGENDDTYDLEMQSFLNHEDIIQPGDEKASEAPKDTGITECQVEVGTEGHDGQRKQDRKKRKKRIVIINHGDDEDADSGNPENSCAGIGTKWTKREALAGTKNTGGKASESCLEMRGNGKKRKSMDLDYELDDDFEDVHFSSPRLDGKVKDRSFQEVFPGEKQRNDSISMKDDQGSKDHGDSDNSSTEHDLSKLLDVPCSQRQHTRNHVRASASELLPDAPSLETLFDLNVPNTGEYSKVNSCPLDLSTDTLHEEQDPAVFPDSNSRETPKTSKFSRNVLGRKGGDSWKKRAAKFGLFKARTADETIDEENEKERLAFMPSAAISEKVRESKKWNISTLIEEGGKSGIPGTSLKKGSEGRESPHYTQRPKLVSKILGSEDEKAEFGAAWGSPGEGSAMFGSGLVCDAVTPCKQDDEVEFDFDQEFSHSFFDDYDALKNSQTPCLFDDDFGCDDPSDVKETAVKALPNEAIRHKTIKIAKTVGSKDETDGKEDTVKGLAGGKVITGRTNSAKDVTDENVACRKVDIVKASAQGNETNGVQRNNATASKKLTTKGANSFKEAASKKVTVRRENLGDIPWKTNSAHRKANTPGAVACNEAANDRLVGVGDFGKTDAETDGDKCFPSGSRLVERVAVKVFSSRVKQSLQNEVNRLGCSELTKHVEEKQTGAIGHSLTKIRPFSFEKTGAKLVQMPNCHSSEPRDSVCVSPLHSMLDEDSDLVAPSPQKGYLNRSCFISGRSDHSKFRNAEPKGELLFSEKLEHTRLSTDRVEKKMLKLRCKTKVSSKEIKPSQGFSNVSEVGKPKSDNKSPSRTGKTSPNALHKGRGELSGDHSRMKAGRDDELAQVNGDSPVLIKRTKKKKSKIFGTKVPESNEDSEDEDARDEDAREEENRPCRFKGDESLIFNGDFSTRNSFGDFGNQVKRLLNHSDDEFEDKGKKNNRKRKPVTNREFVTSKKSKPQEKCLFAGEFLDNEAEVSDGIDDCDSSGEQLGVSADEYEESFIDDRTQLTQGSPITTKTHKNKRQPVDMMEIYRKSLLTPHRQPLRFHTPAFHRYKNRYKMVFNKGHHSRSRSSFQADGEEYDFLEEVEESGESDGGDVTEEKVVGEISVSPEESQVVIQKNRRRRKRLLPESYFESPDSSTEPEQQAEVSLKNKSPGTVSSYSRQPRVEVAKSQTGRVHVDRSKISANSPKSSLISENSVFKCPVGGISNRWAKILEGKTESSSSCGNEEEMNNILAALEDSDESLLMEMNEIPSFSLGFGIRPSNTGTVSKATKTKLFSDKSDQHRTSRNDPNKRNGTRSLSPKDMNNNFGAQITVSNNAWKTSNDLQTCRVAPLEKYNTNAVCLPNKRSSSKRTTMYIEPGHRANTNSKLGDKFSWKTNRIKKEVLAHVKPTLPDSHNRNLVTSYSDETGDKQTKTSPLYPPLATNSCSSFKETDSYTDVSLQARIEPASSFDKETTFGTPDGKINGEKTITTSPPLTPLQRDKNKLTILVGAREVSNCQITSLLRRKHNIRTVVCQITGCDYIVSNRMGVERKLVSDISNPTNMNKLTERVRELCDLYDRPCLVIEKDRLRQGETENKPIIRTKYFNRVLACLAQTHVKVMFSDSQEGTSNILASLAQIEGKKNASIIYPLPLSKDKEQAVKFLSSIPRMSYITAVSLCYHSRTLQDVINSSAKDLVRRTKNLSLKRANDIVKFLNHAFCVDMVSLGNT